MRVSWIYGTLFRVVSLIAAAVTACPGTKADTAVRFEWGGEFETVFDNREGDGTRAVDRTFFLTRLAPEAGISFDGGMHSVMGGVVWVQPIGCEWEGHRLSPTLYYRYRRGGLTGALGMFPRRLLHSPLPDYLLSDSARYEQANIRGGMVGYESRHGWAEGFIDWRGMQSETRREAFAVVGRGEWRHGIWRAGGTAMMNHLARSRNAPETEHVTDNIIINPEAGISLDGVMAGREAGLDVRLGWLYGLSRDRGAGDWLSSSGVRLNVEGRWWRLYLGETLWYADRPLFPLYDTLGALLNDGEPYYRADRYSATRLGVRMIEWRGIVSLRGELDFHVTPGDFMFYQRLLLAVTF